MRSMRELSSPPGGNKDVLVTEYPWKVAPQVAEEEASLEPVQSGQSVRNGRTDIYNRRPPE